MKLLIVGGGGREHALAWKLRQSPRVEAIFCAPGMPGPQRWAQTYRFRLTTRPGWSASHAKIEIGLTVVGPDDPLGAGLVDDFEKEVCGFLARTNRLRAWNRRKFSPSN
jgi:phosphoribosylamine--glycine ligase